MSGFDVTGYHLGNLLVHVLSALVLFGIVRRTLASGRLAEALRTRANAIALFAALWWGVHPLVSEVVNYTTQRTESLMGLFFLLTLYCAMRAVDSPRRGRWLVLSAASCACGMATKESMVVAPLVVLLYDRVFVFSTWADAVRERKWLYAAFGATWVELASLVLLQPRSTVGFATHVDAWTICGSWSGPTPSSWTTGCPGRCRLAMSCLRRCSSPASLPAASWRSCAGPPPDFWASRSS
jgi:hypothetical protein